MSEWISFVAFKVMLLLTLKGLYYPFVLSILIDMLFLIMFGASHVLRWYFELIVNCQFIQNLFKYTYSLF
jgi:hypothetical protein